MLSALAKGDGRRPLRRARGGSAGGWRRWFPIGTWRVWAAPGCGSGWDASFRRDAGETGPSSTPEGRELSPRHPARSVPVLPRGAGGGVMSPPPKQAAGHPVLHRIPMQRWAGRGEKWPFASSNSPDCCKRSSVELRGGRRRGHSPTAAAISPQPSGQSRPPPGWGARRSPACD